MQFYPLKILAKDLKDFFFAGKMKEFRCDVAAISRSVNINAHMSVFIYCIYMYVYICINCGDITTSFPLLNSIVFDVLFEQ